MLGTWYHSPNTTRFRPKDCTSAKILATSCAGGEMAAERKYHAKETDNHTYACISTVCKSLTQTPKAALAPLAANALAKQNHLTVPFSWHQAKKLHLGPSLLPNPQLVHKSALLFPHCACICLHRRFPPHLCIELLLRVHQEIGAILRCVKASGRARQDLKVVAPERTRHRRWAE